MSLNQPGTSKDARYLARASCAIVAMDNMLTVIDEYCDRVTSINAYRTTQIESAGMALLGQLQNIANTYRSLDDDDSDDDDDDD